MTLIAAFALGLLHTAGFLDDQSWPLQIAALAGLFALCLRTQHAGRAFALGFAFGLGWFTSGIHWIFISLYRYGEMSMAMAGGATFALCAYLALYPALACALAHRFGSRRKNPLAAVLVLAAFWTASEFGRGFVLTGFPWLAGGYAHIAGPLGGFAPLIGVYGVGFIAALLAASVAVLGLRYGARHRLTDAYTRLLPYALLALLFGLPLAGAALRHIEWAEPSGTPLHVRLLQGNIPQDVKFDENRFGTTVALYLRMIEAKPADLTVLPETALIHFIDDLPPSLIERLESYSTSTHTALAFGIPIAEDNDRYFNSVAAITPAGRPWQRYDKYHLVPFGEFIPTGFHWFVKMLNMPLGEFTRGTTTPAPMHIAGHRIAFNICYEDVFGEEIIRQSHDAEILINITNVAWFGDSLALPQHLQISRMRALETARPMLRATNTGMTAVINPHGVVEQALPAFTEGVLEANVQGTRGDTPFTRYGNTPVAILIALLILLMTIPELLPTRNQPPQVKSD